MKVSTNNYVEFYDPLKSHHRVWLQAALDRLQQLDPTTLQDGGELRDLWRAAVETKAPGDADPPWLAPALRIIREFEGCRLDAYRCPAGVWSIGYGATRMASGGPVRSGDRITQQQADALLNQQVRQLFGPGIASIIKPWKRLAPNAQAALVSWAFNVGLGAAEESTLRKRLNKGDDPNVVAREELPRWSRGEKGILQGLVRRRAAEVALFTSGSTPVAPAARNVGPKKRPNLKPGDHHLVMDDRAQTLQAFTHDGRSIWTIPALARGQGADDEWQARGTDTPPGLYLCGQVYRDLDAAGANPSSTAERLSYGWYSIDMEGLEGQEGPGSKWGRDGIMLHGGGTACGWPGAWAPRQQLFSTLGCIRCHNADIKDKILPLVDGPGDVYVSVFQEGT